MTEREADMDEKITHSQKIKNEKSKISSMDKHARRQYFFDYYFWKVIGVCVVLAMIISVLCETVFFWKEPVYSGCEVNLEVSEQGREWLTTQYNTYLGNQKKNKKVELTYCLIDFYADEQAADSKSDQMALYAELVAGDFDYILLGEDGLEGLKGKSVLADLREALPANWREKLEDRFVYDETETGKIPVAIDVTNTPFVKKAGIKDAGVKVPGKDEAAVNENASKDETVRVYLAFVSTKMDKNKSNAFLEYIWEEN